MDTLGVQKLFDLINDYLTKAQLDETVLLFTFKEWSDFEDDDNTHQLQLSYNPHTHWDISSHTLIYVAEAMDNIQTTIYCWDLGQLISIQVI